MAQTETLRERLPQIAGLKSAPNENPCVRVHLEFASPEYQRHWDEVVEREEVRVASDPEDDTYVIPVAFPMEILLAFNAKVVESQKTIK